MLADREKRERLVFCLRPFPDELLGQLAVGGFGISDFGFGV
jgi:hypothetical protein